jgi:hypothetical protein
MLDCHIARVTLLDYQLSMGSTAVHMALQICGRLGSENLTSHVTSALPG